MKAAIQEMLEDYDFMDKLSNKQQNEVLLASLDEHPKISLPIINKWEKHNGLSYDKTGTVDEVCKAFGITC